MKMSEKADRLTVFEGPFSFPSLSCSYPFVFQRLCLFLDMGKGGFQLWVFYLMSPLPDKAIGITITSSLGTVWELKILVQLSLSSVFLKRP